MVRRREYAYNSRVAIGVAAVVGAGAGHVRTIGRSNITFRPKADDRRGVVESHLDVLRSDVQRHGLQQSFDAVPDDLGADTDQKE